MRLTMWKKLQKEQLIQTSRLLAENSRFRLDLWNLDSGITNLKPESQDNPSLCKLVNAGITGI